VRARLLERLVSVAPAGLGARLSLQLRGHRRGAVGGDQACEALYRETRDRGGHARLSRAHVGALGHLGGGVPRASSARLVPGFSHVPYNKLDALQPGGGWNTAAVILEVVQGEGGVNLGTAEDLLGARQWVRREGGRVH